MALFGTTTSFIGLDIGTSSLKIVELVDRRRRREVATYAQANMPNMLTEITDGNDEDEIREVANVITKMMDGAGVSTDHVVAALPNSAVFSSVLTLPDLPGEDLERAVHFAARDVVPASLDDMVLGWSRVGQLPQMESSAMVAPTTSAVPGSVTEAKIPVFITAAPKELVARYTKLTELLQLELVALEVETFPLIRSLLGGQAEVAMIVDIGDLVTTLHIIDGGTARVSQTIDAGGKTLTATMAERLGISEQAAEQQKVRFGLHEEAPSAVREATMQGMQPIFTQARQLQRLYQQKSQHAVSRAILIGGGANLRRLPAVWTDTVGINAMVGDPWKGLSYPHELETRLHELGPTYAVAVGLAQRGFTHV